MQLYLKFGEYELTPTLLQEIESSIKYHAPNMQKAREACYQELLKHKGKRVLFFSKTTSSTTRLQNWGNNSLNPFSWCNLDGSPLFSDETNRWIKSLQDKGNKSGTIEIGRKDLWTREQLILTFQLYLKLEFGKMHSRNPDVIALAELIGRTPSSVAMRLTNFASVDPYHKGRGIKGLEGGSKQVQPIWDEFHQNRESLLFQSEEILARFQHLSLEEKYPELKEYQGQTGETKERLVKTRVNQHVFRQMVLANYNNRCAITGINIPSLLVASHIIPWAENEKERLNPENGICLSPLYDRAFDQGLIGITPDLEIRLSDRLQTHKREPFFHQQFAHLQGTRLREAEKYPPRREFLEWHWGNTFASTPQMHGN